MAEKNQSKSKESNGMRGGARKGAGRKAGSTTKRTREIADKAMENGLTPLEYMLELMREASPDTDDARVKMDHKAMRFEAAKAAAPYIHPRLAAVEHTGGDGTPLLPTVINLVRSGD